MKKRKQKALKYLGLSIVCFGLHACSIFLEPFAVNSENKVAAGGYILGTDHGSDSAGILRPYYRGKSDGKHPGRCSSGSYGDHVIYFLSAHDSKWQSLQIYDNE